MKKAMDKKRFVEEVTKLQKISERLQEQFDAIQGMFGSGVADSTLFEASYKALDAAIAHLSELSGDDGEWIAYYLYEALNMKDGGAAQIGKRKIAIKTPADVWTVIRATERKTEGKNNG